MSPDKEGAMSQLLAHVLVTCAIISTLAIAWFGIRTLYVLITEDNSRSHTVIATVLVTVIWGTVAVAWLAPMGVI